MARPLKPFIRGGGYFPSKRWTPLVYPGGYTTMNGGEQPTPVYWKTITGVSPLSLVNAVANSIKSLTQYGLCTQASTPTPSDPVDIYCNNGAIKFNVNLDSIYVDGTPEVLTVTATGAETQTASVESLLSVEDYSDEQDIIAGTVTRRVGIKVFDGAEWWREATHKGVFYTSAGIGTISDTLPVLSNQFTYSRASNANMPNYSAKLVNTSAFGGAFHFVYDECAGSVEGWQEYLAAQYTAGTPVIIIYPLAEETKEQTTAQNLHSYEGTTVVDADTNVDPVTLSAEYASSEE